MEETKPRGRKIWVLLAAALPLLLMAIALGLYLLGSTGLSARDDDPQAILAAYAPESFDGGTLGPDGAATVRLTREDIYWFAQQYGLLDTAEQKIEAAGIDRWGFLLTGSQAAAYLRMHVLGFLPVTCRAEMSLAWADGELVLTTEAVHLGRYLPLMERLWPAPLRTPVHFPLGLYGQGIRDIRVENGALIADLDGLLTAPAGDLTAEEGDLAAALTLFSDSQRQALPALDFLRDRTGGGFPAGEAWTYALADGAPGEALAQVLSLCTETSEAQVMERTAPLFRDTIAKKLLTRSAQLRETMGTNLRSAQASYERVLSSLREMYKSGALRMTQSGFENAATGESVGPESLPDLSATATDSRVVFLYSARPSGEISTEDMPPVSRIPLARGVGPDKRLDPDTVYDIGAALTSEGGVPLLLHRRQDGTFVLRELTEEMYVGLLVERSIPVLDVDTLPAPVREIPRPAGEPWTAAALLLLS